jgi:hypothetical protein
VDIAQAEPTPPTQSRHPASDNCDYKREKPEQAAAAAEEQMHELMLSLPNHSLDPGQAAAERRPGPSGQEGVRKGK